MPKNRYWVAVGYPESMIEDWQLKIDDLVQVPFAYCIHDKDVESNSNERKTHVHIILAFSNTTTYKHALEVFQTLGKINYCEPIYNIRNKYDYLIHATKKAISDGKYQYSEAERVTGNNFDIGSYEQISIGDKKRMLTEIKQFQRDNEIDNFYTLSCLIEDNFDSRYWDILDDYSGVLEKRCKGCYFAKVRSIQSNQTQNEQHETHETHEKSCPKCGSSDIKKKGKTASDLQRYVCKECGKSFVEGSTI
jgi:rubrerythrin